MDMEFIVYAEQISSICPWAISKKVRYSDQYYSGRQGFHVFQSLSDIQSAHTKFLSINLVPKIRGKEKKGAACTQINIDFISNASVFFYWWVKVSSQTNVRYSLNFTSSHLENIRCPMKKYGSNNICWLKEFQDMRTFARRNKKKSSQNFLSFMQKCSMTHHL